MSSCYKTSDNKFHGCPPRMDDGRHFTDYRPTCHVNDCLKVDNTISNSYQYRMFLQENGETLMDKNREIACSKNCCAPSPATGVENFSDGTMLSEKYKTVCDKHTCKILLNDVNGIGTGRNYYTNNAGCDSLPKAWPKNQTTNSCASPLDNFSYIGDNVEVEMARVAVPGGGDVLSGGDLSTRVNM